MRVVCGCKSTACRPRGLPLFVRPRASHRSSECPVSPCHSLERRGASLLTPALRRTTALSPQCSCNRRSLAPAGSTPPPVPSPLPTAPRPVAMDGTALRLLSSSAPRRLPTQTQQVRQSHKLNRRRHVPRSQSFDRGRRPSPSVLVIGIEFTAPLTTGPT